MTTTEPPNVVAEYQGTQIAMTTDCKFMTVESGDDKKYSSLRAAKKAIDVRLTGNKLNAFVRGVAEMNLTGHMRLADHDGEDAITALDALVEQAREIIRK
jgi:hypothetical protein